MYNDFVVLWSTREEGNGMLVRCNLQDPRGFPWYGSGTMVITEVGSRKILYRVTTVLLKAAGLRAVPVDEFSDGMTVRSLGALPHIVPLPPDDAGCSPGRRDHWWFGCYRQKSGGR